MNSEKCKTIFERFKRNNPEPTTELIFNSPFELLIAVILSAQATDISVNKATKILFKVADTPEKMLNLGEENLKGYIKNIGLYNTKAKNIIKTCQLLLDQYHSQVPGCRQELELLPGVGRKTANVVLNTLFKQAVIAVDTHIFRVANRIGLTKGKNPKEVEDQLTATVPSQYLYDAHHWLVLHGRYICIARKPKCPECFINDLCEFPAKTAPATLN